MSKINVYENGNWTSVITNKERIIQEKSAKVTAVNPYTDDYEQLLQQMVFDADQDELHDIMNYKDPIAEVHNRYGFDSQDAAIGAHVQNLIALIKSGNKGLTGLDYQDFVFDGMPYSNYKVIEMRNRQYQREMVNTQLNNIFTKENIVIPKNQSYMFSISEDWYLHVDGPDKEIAKKIENALNKDNNQIELTDHIYMCCYHSVKKEDESLDKQVQRYYLDRDIRQLSSYKLNDLHKDENGVYILPDGKNASSYFAKLAQLVDKSYPELDTDAFEYQVKMRFAMLENDAENYSKPFEFKIRYENGSLYDVMGEEQFGTGKTSWLDELENECKKNVYKVKDHWKYGNATAQDIIKMAKEHGAKIRKEEASTGESLKDLWQPLNLGDTRNEPFQINLWSSGVFRVENNKVPKALLIQMTKLLNHSKVGEKLAGQMIYSLGNKEQKEFISLLERQLVSERATNLSPNNGLKITIGYQNQRLFFTPMYKGKHINVNI